jgi:hypothetical protein
VFIIRDLGQQHYGICTARPKLATAYQLTQQEVTHMERGGISIWQLLILLIYTVIIILPFWRCLPSGAAINPLLVNINFTRGAI